MPVIYCNIQLFSCDQMIYVLGPDGKALHVRKVDIEDLPRAICALATEYGATKVGIAGSQVYTMAWAEEIKTVYALNYGKNDLEVEIIVS